MANQENKGKCETFILRGNAESVMRQLVDDVSMIEEVDVWEDGDKIRCINDSEKNTLKLNEIYTVDTSMNTTDNRVYVKENKRFSFLKSRFELVEV